MISGKDVRIENGYIIINGNKYPIVQDVSKLKEEVDTLSETVGDEASGLVKDVSDNTEEISTIKLNVLDGKRYKVYSENFSGVDITAAWGSWYITAGSVLSISYSDLGLTEPPAGVFLSVKTENNAFMIMQIDFTASEVEFHLVRPNSVTGVSATINALVVY